MYRKGLCTLVMSTSIALIAGCAGSHYADGPPLTTTVKLSDIPNAKPQYEPKSRYGNASSYIVHGRRYHVRGTARGYKKRGIASWYGRKFDGRLTSNRERYDMFAMTAANKVLPLPSYVRVTNLENGRSVIVRVNDRGPFVGNRIIDLSYAAAKKLGYARKGTALVEVSGIDVNNPDYPSSAPVLAHRPRMYLQVAAFSHYDYAQRLRLRLQQLTSRPIRIYKAFSHAKPLYRVQIGPLMNVDETDTLYNRLENAGYTNTMTVIS